MNIQKQIDMARQKDEREQKKKELAKALNEFDELQPKNLSHVENYSFLNQIKQLNTELQERQMLTQLNEKGMQDYFLIKEKGDDVRVYTDEKDYVPFQALNVNNFDELILSKTCKLPIIPKPKSQKPKKFDYHVNKNGLLVVKQQTDEQDDPRTEYKDRNFKVSSKMSLNKQKSKPLTLKRVQT